MKPRTDVDAEQSGLVHPPATRFLLSAALTTFALHTCWPSGQQQTTLATHPHARTNTPIPTDTPAVPTTDSLPPPRPIAPLSTALVTSQRPVLRWELRAGTNGARVEVCRDRAMTRDCMTFDATGTTGTPPSALASGVCFWRLRGRAGESAGTATSPVWEFWVPVRSAPVRTTWGTALDINGDGYTDFAVGSPLADESRGRVDVFLGGPGGLGTTPSATLRATTPGGQLGFSVASAGDINGDGYADLIVAAPFTHPHGREEAGTVHVYLGGPSGLTATPHQVLVGTTEGDWFGVSIASAGDINGDGYADVVVGASMTARASVYLGGPGGLTTAPHQRFQGTREGNWFTVSVASAGDINGDGYGDLAIGIHGASLGKSDNIGKTNVYLGGPSGLTPTPHQVLHGAPVGDGFGGSVASAGDINGDGYADLVVGAHLADPGRQSDAGTATVYLGGPSGLTPTPHQVLTGTAADDWFGYSVATAGDINGDGYADLVVGAPSANPAGRRAAGTATVYLGGPSGLTPTPHQVLTGTAEGDRFGASVATLGDANGDGYADLILGAPGASPGGRREAGVVSVYLGAPTGLRATPNRVLEGTAAWNTFGASLAGAAW